MPRLARSRSARGCGTRAARCFGEAAGSANEPIAATRVQFDAREVNGGQGSFVSDQVTLEDEGPLRVTVRQTGRIGGLKHPLLVDARVTVFAGSPVFRLDVSVRNPSAATHPGGTWDLGDPGSLMLERLTLTVPLAPGGAGAPVRRPSVTRLNRVLRSRRPARRWRSIRIRAAARRGSRTFT